MTLQDMAAKIEAACNGVKATPRYGNQIEVIAQAESVVNTLSVIRSLGFEHLCEVTAVDWIEEGIMEVVYNIWSYDEAKHLTVKAVIDREEAAIESVIPVWEHAQPYEQYIHEMFGIVFKGNPDLTPLVLHNWQDIPPLRKDFITEEYVRKAYK